MLDLNSLKILFLFFPGIISVSIIQLFSSKKKKFSSTEIFMYSFIYGVFSYILAYVSSNNIKGIFDRIQYLKSMGISPKEFFFIPAVVIIIFLLINRLICYLKNKTASIHTIGRIFLIVFSLFFLNLIKDFNFKSILFFRDNQIIYLVIIFTMNELGMILPKIRFNLVVYAFLITLIVPGLIFFISKDLDFQEILIGILNNESQEISMNILLVPLLGGITLGWFSVVIVRTGLINNYIFKSKISYDGLGDLKNSLVKITMNDNSRIYTGKIAFFEFYESQIEILLEEAKIISKNNKNKCYKGSIYLTLLPGTYHIEKSKITVKKLFKEKKLHASSCVKTV